MKYKVLSINFFADSYSVQYYKHGECFELEEALKISKEMGEEKGLNGYVHHAECIEPIEDSDALKKNNELKEHEKLMSTLSKRR